MFWFDPHDPRAVFVDRRKESHAMPDKSSSGGMRDLVISPDVVADFTAMPFPDESFALVVFDLPHFRRNGDKSWCGLKYGTLAMGWEAQFRKGFAECFRVLRPDGVLIFKWCESDIPLAKVLACTPERPLFGNKNPRGSGTHWVTFMKASA